MPAPLPPIDDLATYRGRYIRPAQLAAYMSIPRRTIYHHIEKGALAVIRRRGVLVIKIEVARAYAGIDEIPRQIA